MYNVDSCAVWLYVIAALCHSPATGVHTIVAEPPVLLRAGPACSAPDWNQTANEPSRPVEYGLPTSEVKLPGVPVKSNHVSTVMSCGIRLAAEPAASAYWPPVNDSAEVAPAVPTVVPLATASGTTETTSISMNWPSYGWATIVPVIEIGWPFASMFRISWLSFDAASSVTVAPASARNVFC